MRWYGDLLWLFVPIQDRINRFLADFDKYPHEASTSQRGGNQLPQPGLRDALRRLKELEGAARPR
jgi:arylsulfatase